MHRFQPFKPSRRILLLSLPLIGGLFFASSCKKSDSTSAPAQASLNSTESAIQGRWYVAETDDTTYIYYPAPRTDTAFLPVRRVDYTTANYIDFQPTEYAALKAQVPQAKSMTDARRGTAGSGYWYVDVQNRLIIQGVQFDIISQTSTELQIRSVLQANSSTANSMVIQNTRLKR